MGVVLPPLPSSLSSTSFSFVVGIGTVAVKLFQRFPIVVRLGRNEGFGFVVQLCQVFAEVIRFNRDDSGGTGGALASGVSDEGLALAGGGRSPYDCRKEANFAVVADFTCCALTLAVIVAAVADCRASWNLFLNDDAAATATVVDLLDTPSFSTGEGAGAGVSSAGGERLGAVVFAVGVGRVVGAETGADVVSIVDTVLILPLLLVSRSSSGSFVSSCILISSMALF